ncbi:hypothetical protein LTR48_006388 [Friedmanniomyces endolithicus]|nr:hypothetical protein LTR48_006388 [Friedmanniomyces endolithicus]
MATPTHAAVVTTAPRTLLVVRQVPTITPINDEVLVRVEWTASTPLDLHQADGGLLVKHPQVLGGGVAGTVLETAEGAKRLKVGDKVFGFQWREQKEKGHQEKLTAPEWLFGKVSGTILGQRECLFTTLLSKWRSFMMQEAVTLPNNFVTAFHTISTDLGLPIPWPKPEGYVPPRASEAILIWGGSSSVGQYALQVLKYYGYRNIIATASPSHHGYLKSLGAIRCFDYRDPNVVHDIGRDMGSLPLIIDCIGSKAGTLAPISQLTGSAAKVAIMLPVIVKASADEAAPEYSMEVESQAAWGPGVEARGVRTHFYLQNELFKEKLQSEIMPTLLAEGIVKPNRYELIEGSTLVERAQNALDKLRSGTVSGARLVWRVAEA